MIKVVGVSQGIVIIVTINSDPSKGYSSFVFNCLLPYQGNKIILNGKMGNAFFTFDASINEMEVNGILVLNNEQYNMTGNLYSKGKKLVFKCQTKPPDNYIVLIGWIK